MDQIELLTGSHKTREQGLCVMEAVAFFAGERHSDAPACACPVIAGFARPLNDNLDDAHRQELKPLIPMLALSRLSSEVGRKRAYVAVDFAVRWWAANALESASRYHRNSALLNSHAATLRALAPIVDKKTIIKGRDAATAAYDAIEAAASAAHAHSAVVSAARAAYDAAYDANDAPSAAAHAAHAAAFCAAAAAYVDDKTRQDYLLKDGLECLNAMLAITK